MNDNEPKNENSANANPTAKEGPETEDSQNKTVKTENSQNKDPDNRDSDKPKVLHKVLLEEYAALGLLKDKEVEKIKELREEQKDAFCLKNEDELKNDCPNAEKYAQESQKQFILRSKYRYRMLEVIRQKIHAQAVEDKPVALCLSGGGIRSATFCLGALQGLAKNNLLGKFHYLSTVSGGGYIGSWFSAWHYREGNLEKLQSALSRNGDYPYLFGLEDFEIDFDGEFNDSSKDKKAGRDNEALQINNEGLDFDAAMSKIKTVMKEIFDPQNAERLASLNPPSLSAIKENRAAKNDLRRFGKALCRELNKLIHNESFESESFKIEIKKELKKELKDETSLRDKNEREESKNQNPQKKKNEKERENYILRKRKKVKRRLIERKLENIVRKIDDFEHVEPPEITYLRTYSNFMSPRTGLFSLDTWTIVVIYLRNLLLNWMVFLPTIAIFLLLPKLFPAVLRNSSLRSFLPYLFGFSIFAGIFAVVHIIAMRPSLSRFSWIKQKYTLDSEGSIIDTEKKVWRWCLIPLLITAFVLTICWVWSANPVFHRLMESLSPGSLPETRKLLGFILLYEILFLVGFFFAHGVLRFRKLRADREESSVGKKIVEPIVSRVADSITGKSANLNTEPPRKKENVYDSFWRLAGEFAASVVSGAFGGAVLYIFARLLAAVPDSVCGWLKRRDYGFCFEENAIYASFGPPLFLVTVLLSTAFFFGIAGRIYNDMDREWLSRFGALILRVIIGWTVISGIVLLFPSLFDSEIFKKKFWVGETIPSSVIIAVVSGLVTLVLGFSGRSPANENKEAKGLMGIVWKFAPQFAAPIFALALIILISYGTSLLMDYAQQRLLARIPENSVLAAFLTSEFWYLAFWILLLAAIAGTMGFFININKFSLHAMYRERLIRAYLGASRTDDRLKSANGFTDLDEDDNVEMYRLGTERPFHIVNMTLNLGEANNLRWQDRKAASFTVSPLHSGSSNMGDGSGYFRSSEEYAYTKSSNRAITLGTVAAISGAAVSPNMGYYSMSSAVSFLMALFNVRLGWWLGNPGKRGDNTYKRSAPLFSPKLFFDEAFGDTSDTNPYVYLSDGGHFDNLGLYEMVLRRCHIIIACDAGADAKFGFFDLGTAIHKIRVDMGIPIVFEAGAPSPGRNCSVARIRYSEIDEKGEDGFLIYIKPTLDGDEPLDVVNYKNINPDFPHETTSDEFYSETQFESYRSLGLHMINSICMVDGKPSCASPLDFKDKAEAYVDRMNAARKSKAERESAEKTILDLAEKFKKVWRKRNRRGK